MISKELIELQKGCLATCVVIPNEDCKELDSKIIVNSNCSDNELLKTFKENISNKEIDFILFYYRIIKANFTESLIEKKSFLSLDQFILIPLIIAIKAISKGKIIINIIYYNYLNKNYQILDSKVTDFFIQSFNYYIKDLAEILLLIYIKGKA